MFNLGLSEKALGQTTGMWITDLVFYDDESRKDAVTIHPAENLFFYGALKALFLLERQYQFNLLAKIWNSHCRALREENREWKEILTFNPAWGIYLLEGNYSLKVPYRFRLGRFDFSITDRDLAIFALELLARFGGPERRGEHETLRRLVRHYEREHTFSIPI